MDSYSEKRRGARQGEDGYVLLMLLLVVALGIIAAAIIVPTIKFQFEHDREEEMIHRGVQYARAIRTYYKKFGRYPTRIEDLENTNNLRFLRKRYKDPMNCPQGKCQDFKLLHFGEAKLTIGGLGGSTIPGATPIGAQGGLSGSGGLAQSSSFGGSSSFGQSSAFGGNSGFGQSSTLGGNSSFGNTNSGLGGNQTAPTPESGSDSSQPSSPEAGTAESNPSAAGGEAAGGGSTSSGDKLSGQVFGGPIVGVQSLSKKTGYREFNHKKKYNEWQFVYDPGTDRGGLINGPNPTLQGLGQQGTQNLNGQNNNQNNSGSSFGSSNSFGTSSFGTQNNPSSPSGSFGTPSQPSSSPQQQ